MKKTIHLTACSYRICAFLIALSILISAMPITVSGFSEKAFSPSEANDFDPRISAEIESKRNAFEKHFLLSDGSFVAVSYAEAVHYKNQKGDWQEVDNTLIEEKATSRIVNSYDAFKASFANSGSKDDLVSISTTDSGISWSLGIQKNSSRLNDDEIITNDLLSNSIVNNAKTSLAYVGKNASDSDSFSVNKSAGKICYSKVFSENPEISVNYSVFHNKIEEDIYINKKTDIKSFSLLVNSNGLIAVVKGDNSVEFVDNIGKMQFCIGIPYMEDASGEVLNNIKVTATQNDGKWVVTYTPDEKWLLSDNRVYPILLDPSITTKEYISNITDTYVFEGDTANHSSEQKLYFGVRSGKVYRSYIKINNLPIIDSSMPILSATLQLAITPATTTGKTARIFKADTSWNPSTITFDNQPYSPNTAYFIENCIGSCDYTPNSTHYTFDISKNISNIYDEYNAAVNYGYIIKHADESYTNPDYNAVYSAEYTSAGSRPLLTITYGYSLPNELINGGVYAFRNSGSSSYMTVHNGNDSNTTNVYQQQVSSFSDLTSKHWFKLDYVASTGGYYIRAMCSSNGTNKVLDIVRSEGYVIDGCNVEIYNPIDALAQHWFIIGIGGGEFKIVPRTNMGLALTAYTSSQDGTSSGQTSSSTGNIFVATYNDTNDYQNWMIVDESGDYKSNSSQYVDDATYYINNYYYGKYIHKNGSSLINAVSGLISSLANTIRWKVTHVGDNEYTIQSTSDVTKYLYASDTLVSLSTAPSSGAFTSNYKWALSYSASGGVLIKNVATNKYLYESGSTISTTATLGTSGTDSYNKRVWRIAKTTYYGNTSSTPYRELTSGTTVLNMIIGVGESKTPTISKYPANALWASAENFTYSTTSSEYVTINNSTHQITSIKSGITIVNAVHKVTGINLTFSVTSSNLLIYQTRNKERVGFANPNDLEDVTPIVEEDLDYGNKDTDALISNGTMISLSDLYQNGSVIPLQNRVQIIEEFFSSQVSYDTTSVQILNSMLNHLLGGSGSDFYNTNLTNAVKSHPNTLVYTNGIINLLIDLIKEHDGDIAELFYDEDLWIDPIQRVSQPMVSAMLENSLYLPYYGFNNGSPLLALTVDGWYGNKIEIEAYSQNENSFSGTVRFVFYDHFGLDTLDLSEEKYDFIKPGVVPGFRQWYIIQHWNQLGITPQPKPFVTIASFTVDFSGTF